MLILEKPWTRQPQFAAKVRAEHAGKIIALWNTASPGGIVYDAAGKYHAPGKGRLTPSENGVVWNGDRSNYAATALTLPEVARNTPYMLACWVNPTNADANADCFVSVGDSTGLGGGGGSLCAIYTGGGGGVGGVYISGYSSDVKSTSTGILVANKWQHIATVYTGGDPNIAGNVSDPSVRPTYLNGSEIAMSGTTGAASMNGLGIAANIAYIGDDWPSGHIYTARAKIGSVVLAVGSVDYLKRLARQHYENPFSLLQPDSTHIPTPAAAVVPSITALSARLITATSAQPRISYS